MNEVMQCDLNLVFVIAADIDIVSIYYSNHIVRKVSKLPEKVRDQQQVYYSYIDFASIIEHRETIPSVTTVTSSSSSSLITIVANVNGKKKLQCKPTTFIRDVLSFFLKHRLGHTPSNEELMKNCLVLSTKINELLPDGWTLQKCGIVTNATVESM